MRIFAFQLVAAISLVVCSSSGADELPPATPEPKDIAALEKLVFNTLVVDCKSTDYSVSVDVNGSRYSEFDSGSKSKVDNAPFKEGLNHVVMSFAPGKTTKADEQSGTLTLVLADEPHPKPNHAMILFQAKASDGAFCVTDLAFQFKHGQAFRLVVKENHWADAEHKKRIYEKSGDGSVWGFNYEHEQEWWLNGLPMHETWFKLSRTLLHEALSDAKDYKPDGSLAAEVKDGNGTRRTYSDAGILLMEMSYRGGAVDGPYKEFDARGTLRIAGDFAADQQDGKWVRYDEKGNVAEQCVYKNGELREGAKGIETGSATR